MRTKLQYGECPGCGASCQPEVVSYDDNGDVEECAICDDCDLIWSYFYNVNVIREVWDDAWFVYDVQQQ